MVRDIELPFNHHTRMSRCQIKFLLYLLTKQDGNYKPKWWPNTIHFKQPLSNLSGISKDSLIDLLKSYYKHKGDSDWLRAILFFTLNLDNLTNETDFTSIDIPAKFLYKGVEYDIVPSLRNVSPNPKVQLVRPNVNKKKKLTILNQNTVRKLNISPSVVEHFKGTKLEDNKIFGTNIDRKIDLKNIEKIETDNKDTKLCIKESHIKQMMPIASVQLYDVVKYNTVRSKEDFLLTLNLMKTDVLSKLNLLKFRKRLRNTSRDAIRSASEYEKDLIKFRSKPNKEMFKDQKKNKKQQMKLKEIDKVESSSTSTEYMVVDKLPLPLDEIIDVVDDSDTNKENFDNSSKENITTAVKCTAANSTCSSKTSMISIPFQQKTNKIEENTDSILIDLTVDDTPTKHEKGTNNLYHFLNISPIISPKPVKKIKQSSPKNLKRLNRHSMPLLNQKDIKSYFNPIPMKLTPEFIAQKLDELKKVCRPCFVKLDLVKDLKPIRSITDEELVDEIKTKIATLPLPIVIEEVASSIVDLTSDENILESFINKDENDCSEIITIHEENSDNIKENYAKLSKVETKNKTEQKPKNDLKIKNNTMKKKKVLIKVKWPSKRITL